MYMYYQMVSLLVYVFSFCLIIPFIAGLMIHTLTGPRLANCPRHSSR